MFCSSAGHSSAEQVETIGHLHLLYTSNQCVASTAIGVMTGAEYILMVSLTDVWSSLSIGSSSRHLSQQCIHGLLCICVCVIYRGTSYDCAGLLLPCVKEYPSSV